MPLFSYAHAASSETDHLQHPWFELHAPRGIFLRMSRRGLAVAVVAFSMAMVIINDLPAAATTLPESSARIVGAQQLEISPAALKASVAIAPLDLERDEMSMVYFTPTQYPVKPSSTISSRFGHRAAPCEGCSTLHSGVDFTPGRGTPVHAIADGVVVSRPERGWGSYVVIEHEYDGKTVYSGYAHLMAGSNAPVGTIVKRGDVIGKVGSTGESTGAHLHFSIIEGNTFVDPLVWLDKHVTEPFN